MHFRPTLVLAIIVTTALLANIPTAAAPAWVKYTHPQLGFSLSYPESWTVQAVSGADFVAVGPAAAGVAGLRLNVNVTHEAVPEGTSADVYHTKSEEALKTIFGGYRLLQAAQVKAGTFPAVLRAYTWKTNTGMDIYQLQLITVDGSRGFIVTGTTGAASTKLEDETTLLTDILVTFRPR